MQVQLLVVDEHSSSAQSLHHNPYYYVLDLIEVQTVNLNDIYKSLDRNLFFLLISIISDNLSRIESQMPRSDFSMSTLMWSIWNLESQEAVKGLPWHIGKCNELMNDDDTNQI